MIIRWITIFIRQIYQIYHVRLQDAIPKLQQRNLATVKMSFRVSLEASSAIKNCSCIILLLLITSASHAGIEAYDWQDYLDRSCDTTLSGAAKRMFGEKSFWVHVDVSMDAWADEMHRDPPQGHCAIDHPPNQEQGKFLQCMAYYKDRWQWYARCRPIVKRFCRDAGGLC